jgi:hypothetical protein
MGRPLQPADRSHDTARDVQGQPDQHRHGHQRNDAGGDGALPGRSIHLVCRHPHIGNPARVGHGHHGKEALHPVTRHVDKFAITHQAHPLRSSGQRPAADELARVDVAPDQDAVRAEKTVVAVGRQEICGNARVKRLQVQGQLQGPHRLFALVQHRLGQHQHPLVGDRPAVGQAVGETFLLHRLLEPGRLGKADPLAGPGRQRRTDELTLPVGIGDVGKPRHHQVHALQHRVALAGIHLLDQRALRQALQRLTCVSDLAARVADHGPRHRTQCCLGARHRLLHIVVDAQAHHRRKRYGTRQHQQKQMGSDRR